MKSAVLVFPGINREPDMGRALNLASGHDAAMVWHAETALPNGTDLVVVPGGFSYGDYLRCGAIAARAPVMGAVRDFAANGGLVLGVCNGFQILCEAGLLPGVLMRNARLKFICKDVHLRVERSDTPFTRGYNAGQIIRVPIAHGEGNYEADEETLKQLEGEGRVLYRYVAALGGGHERSKINGAAQSIAGNVNDRGNLPGVRATPAPVPRPTRSIRCCRSSPMRSHPLPWWRRRSALSRCAGIFPAKPCRNSSPTPKAIPARSISATQASARRIS